MKGTYARTRLAPWAATVGARKDAGATRMPPRHKFREETPMSTLPRGADRRVGPDENGVGWRGRNRSPSRRHAAAICDDPAPAATECGATAICIKAFPESAMRRCPDRNGRCDWRGREKETFHGTSSTAAT